MKNIINILLLSFLVTGVSYAQTIDAAFFAQVDKFLSKNVNDGLVNYSKASSGTELTDLIKKIESADLSNVPDNTKKAFYINAYNLNVIHLISKSYPTSSPMDISGFFDNKKIKVAGQTLTLNTLEKDRLMKKYKDARLHFVLVCGAMGCPPITNFAYTPDQLESQLIQQTKRAMNDKSFLKVNENRVELSQIFKWYADDFGGNQQSIIEFINDFKSAPVSTSADVSYYEYDWTLNDTKKTAR